MARTAKNQATKIRDPLASPEKKQKKRLDFVAKVKVFLLARCNYIVNDFIIYLLN